MQMTQHCLKNKDSMWNHLNKQRQGVALQLIHMPRLISIQTEIKRLSQVQYIIALSSKNFLSHHHRFFFLTTTNIIVQLETENNSPSRKENYITMTTQKKFNYQQEGADAVLIVCVSRCVLACFSSSSPLCPLPAGICCSLVKHGRMLFCPHVCG